MLKALATIVAVVGAVMLYETETQFPAHATPAHRAIPIAVYLAVVVVLAVLVKSRENSRRGRGMRSSRGGSSSYPFH